MGDVKVGYGETAAKTAQALLDAAEELDLGAGVVKTHTDGSGGFLVPEEVADKAGVDFEKLDEDEDSSLEEKVETLGGGSDEGEVEGDEVLRGAALDQALEDADLPKTGTADEKRARLAEYNADKE